VRRGPHRSIAFVHGRELTIPISVGGQGSARVVDELPRAPAMTTQACAGHPPRSSRVPGAIAKRRSRTPLVAASHRPGCPAAGSSSCTMARSAAAPGHRRTKGSRSGSSRRRAPAQARLRDRSSWTPRRRGGIPRDRLGLQARGLPPWSYDVTRRGHARCAGQGRRSPKACTSWRSHGSARTIHWECGDSGGPLLTRSCAR
jgi:hypothetical protein